MIFYARKNLLNYNAIRNKVDILNLLLNIYTISNLRTKKDKEELTIHIVDEKNQNRIYIYENEDNQIQSFHSPFILKIFDEDYEITFENPIFQDKINYSTISFLKRVINSNSKDFDSFIENFWDSYNESINISGSEGIYWNLLVYLLSYDTGYFRFDNDPSHQNGKIHPLYHLDINYDNSSTFKIGLHYPFTTEDLINLTNKSSDSKYFENEKIGYCRSR